MHHEGIPNEAVGNEETNLLIYQHLAELLQRVWTGVVAINNLPIPEGEIMELPEDDGTPYECDNKEYSNSQMLLHNLPILLRGLCDFVLTKENRNCLGFGY